MRIYKNMYICIYICIYNICIYLTFSATPKVWHLLLTSLERSKIYSSNIHELHASKDTTNDELAQMIFQKASHWDHRTTYVACLEVVRRVTDAFIWVCLVPVAQQTFRNLVYPWPCSGVNSANSQHWWLATEVHEPQPF